MNDLLSYAIEAARCAGEAILPFYGIQLEPIKKGDGSPLTAADQASHASIVQKLRSTGLPIVSEEDQNSWTASGRYWLVDPLDGTKEFLSHSDEFCVCIALIEEGVPVLGVLFAPARNELYYGANGVARKESYTGTHDLVSRERSTSLRIASSKSHPSRAVSEFAESNSITEFSPMGSALKYARLAEGTVDAVPRFVGSSEWDVAAGHAILRIVGGDVHSIRTGQSLTYGRSGRRLPLHIGLRWPYRFDEFSLPSLTEEDE